MRQLGVVGVWAALLMGAASLPLVGAAQAEPGPVPVATDDVIITTPFLDRQAEVLANDGGGDPVAADLQVCRFDPPGAGLKVSIWSHDGWPGDPDMRPGSTYLAVTGDARLPVGDHRVEYAACDRHRTAWATLTVSVRRVGAPRIAGAPSRIRFTNPLERPISVSWWHPGARHHDLRVAPGRTRDVEVGPAETRWVAFGDVGAEESTLLDRGRVSALSVATSPATPPVVAAASVGRDGEPDDVSPPFTTPDHITLEYYGQADVPVLANDSDDRPGDLAICRIDGPAIGSEVTALPVPSWAPEQPRHDPVLDVVAGGARGGDYVFTYYACDREQLTPGTLTVHVRDFPFPRVRRVAGHPGLVRVHNRGYRTIDVEYFRAGASSGKRHLRVAPHRAATVRVPYDTMAYFVETAVGPLMHGRLRHVQQR